MALRLDVLIGGDATGFNRTMKGIVSSGINPIKNALAGAFTVGAITSLAQKTLEYADSIEEVSNRLGVGAEKYQEWLYAAKQSGVEAEKLTTFIEQLTNAAMDAKNISGFAAMGINPEGKTPEQLFQDVSGYTKGKSATEISSALQSAGLSIRQIGPMINLLQSDLSALGQEARGVGAVMDNETRVALAKLKDQFDIVSQILVSQFGPALLEVAKIALRAFGELKGGAQYGGAITAGVSGNDVRKLFLATEFGGTLGMASQLYAIAKKIATDPNIESYKATAENLYTGTIDGIDSMLKKLTEITPQIASTIHPGAIGGAIGREKDLLGIRAGSGLVSVGNFLGTGRANSLESVAQKQLAVQTRTANAVEKIANKETGGSLNYD